MKIALVSYINTRPFIDGLQRHFSAEEVEIHALPPAECAVWLKEKRCEMALIPVGSLLDFENIALLPDYCIGADGAVNSVFIFSQIPIEETDTLLLDRHSRSSNGLAKVLLKHFWKKEMQFESSGEKNFAQIEGKKAGVVIGDKALKIKGQYQYVYDLSYYWKQMTGLPFVFAAWAFYEDQVSPEMQQKITQALADGILYRKETAVNAAADYGLTINQAIEYLEHDIKYEFTDARHLALEKYLGLLKEIH
ncbi:MAG: menaquinone biosynthetic enzyme MqnA/MqnD family protein [Bacteroidia bacterium]